MKASILFGAGWENDSAEVLWRESGRLFCRLERNDAHGERHAFIPISSDGGHSIVESVRSPRTRIRTYRSTWTARGHCGRWNSCASADRRCS